MGTCILLRKSRNGPSFILKPHMWLSHSWCRCDFKQWGGAQWMQTSYICRVVLPVSRARKPLRALFSAVAKEIRMAWLTTSICGGLSHAPYWGPGPQPRHVPWLGTEPVPLWFAGQHSIHWAAPARATVQAILKIMSLFSRRYLF